MTDREREVLAVMLSSALSAGPIARRLNLVEVSPGKWASVNRCAWCPVGPPRRGEKCASVPRTSRDRVNRVLKSLLKKGLIRDLGCHRYPVYVPVTPSSLT